MFSMKRSLFLKLAVFFSLSLAFNAHIYAQEARPFWDEIQQFRHRDSLSMPQKHGIVFLGSSSVRKWVNAEANFKEYNVINRGFGGSTLAQAADYVNYLVFPYEPRQVVIYSGENDIAIDKIDAEATLDRLKNLVSKIRDSLPNVPIVFLSIKESPSRTAFREVVLQANSLIKDYLSKLPNARYLDVNAKMLDANGATRPELFQDDMLHMKPEGYVIWERELKPYLIK
jgi:lysophospholipase L1-like esterase